MHFHRNIAVPGIEICEVGRSLHRFPNHSHEDFYAFSLMEIGGSLWNGSPEEKSLVAPGNIAVIPPGLVHSGAPVNGKESTYKMLYIDNSVISETASDIFERDGFLPEFTDVVMQSPGLVPLYTSLYETINSDLTPMEVDSALTSFLAEIITEFGTGRLRPSTVKDGDSFLERGAACLAADLDEKISLEVAAAEAGLSKYHFLRMFKARFGISPHVYRTQKRIETAKELMRKGLSFAEIAYKTGFSDQSHFSNQFRKYTGATPGQYLAQGP